MTPAGMFHEQLLQRAIEILGAEHILFSTDYPLRLERDQGARRFIQEVDLTDEQRHLIAHKNAESIFRFPETKTHAQSA